MATASEKFMVLRDRKAVADPCELAWAWERVVGTGMELCGHRNALILTYAQPSIGVTPGFGFQFFLVRRTGGSSYGFGGAFREDLRTSLVTTQWFLPRRRDRLKPSRLNMETVPLCRKDADTARPLTSSG